MTATILFANNAKSSLAAPINTTATSLTLETGTGVKFPSPSGGNYFVLVLTDAATGNTFEVLHVTARTGDVCTVVRAQESTTALNWTTGDFANNVVTAGTMDALQSSTASVTPPPINAQTGTAYTLQVTDVAASASDAGIVTLSNAAAITLTVPTNAAVPFVAGTTIQIIQLGAGQVTVSADMGVTINTPSSLTARAQFSTLLLTYLDADEWVLSGDMT